MSTLTNPHDRFFKAVFSRKEVAQDFLRNYLPADVAALLEPESLEYVKDSFIDPVLQEYYSDLIFRVSLKSGAPGRITFLMEHKSYQEPLIAFHLLRYMVNLWEHCLKQQNNAPLPVIIPVVLYHGSGSWNAGTSLHDLIPCPLPMQPFLPDFQYLLWDASVYADEQITGTASLQAALLLFKYIFRSDFRERLSAILNLLNELLMTGQSGIDFLITVLQYIIHASPSDVLRYDDITQAVAEAFPRIGDTIMPTIADVLREEGLQQGIEKGREFGIELGTIKTGREAVLEILEIRFAQVPPALTERIRAIQDSAVLKRLHRQALQVDSLEDFTALLPPSA